jgi:hypothetical protein
MRLRREEPLRAVGSCCSAASRRPTHSKRWPYFAKHPGPTTATQSTRKARAPSQRPERAQEGLRAKRGPFSMRLVRSGATPTYQEPAGTVRPKGIGKYEGQSAANRCTRPVVEALLPGHP